MNQILVEQALNINFEAGYLLWINIFMDCTYLRIYQIVLDLNLRSHHDIKTIVQ